MLDMTKEIIAIASAALGVLATAVPFVIGFVRKARQFVKERDWNKVMDALPGYITEAEKFLNYTGAEKKGYVKSRLAVYAIENKIRFDESKFDGAIDGIVGLTKQVNGREKDKTVPTAQKSVLPLVSGN
jgi:hypothetical protein